jgi:hypothetical protein
MRCPDCNKFASMEMQEPEVSNLEIDVGVPDPESRVCDARVTAEIRIIRTCAECGTELKEATFTVEDNIEIALPKDAEPGDVSVDEASVEGTEEGGGRYKKSYYGADLHYTVECNGAVIHSGNMTDKVPASSMDELV